MTPRTINRDVLFCDLGEMDYGRCLALQRELFNGNVNAKLEARGGGYAPKTTHYLLTVRHPHVYTLGKSGREKHLLVTEEHLRRTGASFYHTDRGGDITYHGPGQLVAYPILDLDHLFTDIGKYLRLLEQVIIDTLETFGVSAGHYPGYTGVWIEPGIHGKERKIAAIGVRTSRWVTMHGFAFNINPDLSFFQNIVPCGITNKSVTSLSAELGRVVEIEEVLPVLRSGFENCFDVKLKDIQADMIGKTNRVVTG